MGYLHIENLYKNQTILLFKECYALEKIHGSSAHISWNKGRVGFFHGGANAEKFERLFHFARLTAAFQALGHDKVMVYGEAHGGKLLGQSHRYGLELKFVGFDVLIGEHWLNVPSAADVVQRLGLQFVEYTKVSTELPSLDAARDAPSVQAVRNGVVSPQPREGVVLRPLIELTQNNGERVIAKHKREAERETATPRQVLDPKRMQVLIDATAIAEEWVTPTRLAHVLDKLPQVTGLKEMRDVIGAMVEDVVREGAGEIVDSREARTAIGKRTAELFKARLEGAQKA